MKRILTLLLLITALQAQAQYTPLLPAGFTPFATQMYYKISAGDTTFIEGASGKGFHRITANQALRDSLDLYAKKASPTFTGIPTAPTAAPGTNTTQLATTAFVAASSPALSATSPIFYSGGVISSQAASATLAGYVTTGAQTFAGFKTFSGSVIAPILNLTANGLSSTANYIGQTMATDDTWKIYGTGSVMDKGELVFELGDNGLPYATGGERFRFSYNATTSGVNKDALIVDYDAISTPNPITAPSFIGDLTGNASTATTLQTARTINGTSFNGSANITITADPTPGTVVSSITGTTNQVIASASTGAVTLSLPQSIGTTSTPSFAALNATDGTQGLVVRPYTGTAGFGAIYPVGVTPGAVNYSFITNGNTSGINGANNSYMYVAGNAIVTAAATSVALSQPLSGTSTATFADYLYSQKTVGNNFILGGSGANYGLISNPSSTSWALGYGTSVATLGTAALTWNTSGNVTVAGLVGAGTRMVVADNVGALSTKAIPSGGGGGTVASVSVNSSNGFSGTSSGGVNPALTLSTTINSPVLAGNGTAISAATTTGSGSTVVLATSPTLTTPNIGAATGTSLYVNGGLRAGGAGDVSNYYVTFENTTIGAGDVDFSIKTHSSALPDRTPLYFDSSTGNVLANHNLSVTGTVTGSNLSGTNTGDQNLAPYATLASPALTGAPTAPTQTAGDNSTKIATTAYVDAKISSGSWTPASSSVTLTVLYSYYQRVGNMVTAFFYVQFPASANSSQVVITGLPLSPYNYYPLNISINDSGLTLYGESATTGGSIALTDNTYTTVTYSQMSSKKLAGSITYRIP